jgi:mono/diheme cytochrome c family protein
MKCLLTAVPMALGLGAAALADIQDDLVARGAYLVEGPMGCGNCHAAAGSEGPGPGDALVGRLLADAPPFTAYASNLTPAGRIADWSDDELARAIREGLRPDGSLIGPPMPFAAYRHIGDADLAAIVAYLRSLAPAGADQPASEYRIRLPPAYGPPVETVTAPAQGPTAEWGEYVAVALAHCMECHSAETPQGVDYTPGEGLGAGGHAFRGPWGVSVASNLTPHPDGLADYSDAEVKRMIVEGIHVDGQPMSPPMPYAYLARMSADDLDAIMLYLRELPPVATD